MRLAIRGDAQDNFFFAGSGAEDIRGGAGNDTVSYERSTAGVTVRLDELTPTGWFWLDLIFDFFDDFISDGSGGYAQGDDLTSIENVTGSMYDDRLHGNWLANTLSGLSGDDMLYGNGGNDTLLGGEGTDQLFGGNGNDTLIGGVGADRLDGGAGFDIASYRYAAEGVFASFGINYFGGEAVGDTYVSVEGLEGSQFGDVLIGGTQGDTLIGLGGRDELFGHEGNDTLDGGEDGDILSGGDQNDTLIGGAGGDSLSGGNHNDVLLGGADNDWLAGESGNDTLNGGAGIDVLQGGEGNDTFVMADLGGYDTIMDFVRGQDKVDLRSIDAIAGGRDNAFTLIGSAGFSGVAGELRVFALNEGYVVAGDVDGDAVADITFGTNVELTFGDFLL